MLFQEAVEASPACLTSILLQKEVSEDDHPENDEEDDDKAEAQLALVIVDSLHPASQQQANTLIKKEKKIFVICKEIQRGAVANSYMRKGFLTYEEMRKYLVI